MTKSEKLRPLLGFDPRFSPGDGVESDGYAAQ